MQSAELAQRTVDWHWSHSMLSEGSMKPSDVLRLSGRSSHTEHTHPFNGPLSGTTQVSRYDKGKTNLDSTGARDSEWQWHQLGHMQVCISLQTDNHASTPPLSFYRPDALPAAQPTASKHEAGCMKVSGVCLSVCLSYLRPPHASAGGFAAVGPAGRRYRSIAARPALSSKCKQCHVVSWTQTR